jgi:hypothetical protein
VFFDFNTVEAVVVTGGIAFLFLQLLLLLELVSQWKSFLLNQGAVMIRQGYVRRSLFQKKKYSNTAPPKLFLGMIYFGGADNNIFGLGAEKRPYIVRL